LSYAERWIDDHLHKTNLLIKRHQEFVYEKEVEIEDEKEFFFTRHWSTCCVMYLNSALATPWLRTRRFLYGCVELDGVCNRPPVPVPVIEPPSFLSSLDTADDGLYKYLYDREEGINQLTIMGDFGYESVTQVLNDDEREVLMSQLYTHEQPVALDEEELLTQFRDNQKKMLPPELQQSMEDVILGKKKR
jgi:hypothetical protein